jgi:hypothetical protein
MFETNVVEKIKTHVLCSITFVENRAVYGIMWKNLVQPERPDDNTIRRMRFACWTTKAKDTHWEYIIFYCISTATMATRTCLNVTFINTLLVFLIISRAWIKPGTKALSCNNESVSNCYCTEFHYECLR